MTFNGAKVNAVFKWASTDTTIDETLQAQLSALQARARLFWKNNDQYHGHIRRVVSNVIGHEGIQLEVDNDKLKKRWKDWCRPGNCTKDGRLSFVDLQSLILEYQQREGEAFIRIHVEGDGVKLEVIDPQRIDHAYQDGGYISLGIETDAYGKALAYYVLTPDDRPYSTNTGSKRIRVGSDNIIHVFQSHFASQRRGIPPAHAAMESIKKVGEWRQYELEAAQMGSRVNAVLKESDTTAGLPGDSSKPVDLGAGQIPVLPSGMDLVTFTSDHPNNNMGGFESNINRGVASALGAAYASYGNDLAGVSYSSGRISMLEERENYKSLQTMIRDQFIDPLFQLWIAVEVGHGRLPARYLSEEVEWQPRGWAWVNPKDEAAGYQSAIDMGTLTPIEICAMQGRSFETVVKNRRKSQEILEKYGFGEKENPEKEEVVDDESIASKRDDRAE